MMNVLRPLLFPAALAVVLSGLVPAGPVLSQALQLPTAVAPTPPGGVQTTAPTSGPTGASKPRAAPAPIRPPAEDQVIGQTFRWNGEKGEMTLMRLGSGFGLRLTAEGFQISNPTEPCAVSLGTEAIPVTAAGRPEGALRYRLEAPICPILFDVLEGALLVHEPVNACVVAAAGCRIQVNGLWGPDAAVLAGQVKTIEPARTRAEAALREGFRQLNERVPPADKRNVAREQAGFSSERTQVCRDFRREGLHGFCATKYTEARAIAIRARLAPQESDRKPAPRPPRPPRPPQP